MISIAIPTKNEERHIGRLLDCICAQKLDEEIEVVVGDADSTDRTREIIESYQGRLSRLAIVPGGLPAVGRNRAARATHGDPILFLDADIALPTEDFLAVSVAHFRDNQLAVASPALIPRSSKAIDSYLFGFYNKFMIAVKSVSPHGCMCIMASRDAFEKSGGYPEDVILAEDHDFVVNCSKYGDYGILPQPVTISVRRLEKEGRFNLSYKYVKAESYRALFGPIRHGVMHYDFTYTAEQDTAA